MPWYPVSVLPWFCLPGLWYPAMVLNPVRLYSWNWSSILRLHVLRTLIATKYLTGQPFRCDNFGRHTYFSWRSCPGIDEHEDICWYRFLLSAFAVGIWFLYLSLTYLLMALAQVWNMLLVYSMNIWLNVQKSSGSVVVLVNVSFKLVTF